MISVVVRPDRDIDHVIWPDPTLRLHSNARLGSQRRSESMSKPDSFHDHINFLIRKSGVFAGADDDCIRSLAEAATWFSIAGGDVLLNQGEPSEAIFITVHGLLGAYFRRMMSGEEIMVDRIGPGELIGEMGFITGEPRSATIRALRTSELLAISRDALKQLASKHPDLLLSLCRAVVRRLNIAKEGKPAQSRPRTFCVLPHVDADAARTFADDLAAELRVFGPTFLVAKEKFTDVTADQLTALEAAHEYVVYLAEGGKTAWSRLCQSQADSILIAVRGADAATRVEPLREGVGTGIPVDLILLWSGNIVPGKTAPWLDSLHPRGHFHVRSRADVGRTARLLAGRGLGLVLSGGGARGISHIGVGRAFAEHGITIDAICGTSIGAYVGGSIAMEWDFETMRLRAHAFSRKHPLRELVLPRWSLLSGRGLRDSLENWFGEWTIEEAPIPYACVTTNLTACTASVHLRGRFKTWVQASCSLPGIFPPIIWEDAVHVDGGIVNNLPTDIIRRMGASYIVAVDVGFGAQPSQGASESCKREAAALPSILELLMRVGTMSGNARGFTTRQQCEVLLVPDVQRIGLLNWRAYDEAIKCGYDCTVANIDRIKRRIPDTRAVSPPAELHL
jgi:NTE family protein